MSVMRDKNGWDELDSWANEAGTTTAKASHQSADPASKTDQDTWAVVRPWLIEKLRRRIRPFRLWRRKDLVLDACHACAEADERLTWDEKQLLISKLPLDRFKFYKLVQIGNDARIDKIANYLPGRYWLLYKISQLSNEQIRTGIRTGVINPSARWETIERLEDPLPRRAKSRR